MFAPFGSKVTDGLLSILTRWKKFIPGMRNMCLKDAYFPLEGLLVWSFANEFVKFEYITMKLKYIKYKSYLIRVSVV